MWVSILSKGGKCYVRAPDLQSSLEALQGRSLHPSSNVSSRSIVKQRLYDDETGPGMPLKHSDSTGRYF